MSSRLPSGKSSRVLPFPVRPRMQRTTIRDARLREIWNAMATACFVCDWIRDARGRIRAFRVCDVNASGMRLAGRPRDELIGSGLSACVPGLWPEENFALEIQVAENGEPRSEECRLEQAGSGERFYEKHLLKCGPGLAVFVRDITQRKQTAELLARSRHELISAQRMGQIGSWLWEIGPDRVTWSEELFRITGLDPAGPTPGYAEHTRLHTPESWARLSAAVETVLRDGRPYEVELELIRPTGEKRWTIARGEAERDASGKIVLLRGTVQDITERKRAELELKSLPHQILEAQEAERRRVARELHDGVSQLLVSVVYRLYALEMVVTGDGRAATTAVRELVAQALGEVRRISHGLRPSALDDLGLGPALRALARDFRARTGVKLNLRLPSSRARLPAGIEQAVYRIAQEALNNIERHAAARQVTLQLARSSRGVRLVVRDDGRGFATSRRGRRLASGLGLHHMRERAEQVGGTFALTAARGGGTAITVELPLRPHPAPALNQASPPRSPAS